MGTTSKDTQANTYNPQSMGSFNQMMGPLGNAISSYISNPFGNPFFQTQQQMGTHNAQNQNQTATSGLVNNMTGSGMAGGASNPAATEMLQNQARAGTANTAQQGFLAPVQNALGMQQGAMQTAAGFKPLQTGGTDTKSTGGLGTWLPQLIGAGLGAAGNIATGGMSGLLGSGIGSLMAGAGVGQPQGGPGQGWAGSMQPSTYSAPTPSWMMPGGSSGGSSGGMPGFGGSPPPAPSGGGFPGGWLPSTQPGSGTSG